MEMKSRRVTTKPKNGAMIPCSNFVAALDNGEILLLQFQTQKRHFLLVLNLAETAIIKNLVKKTLGGPLGQ